MADLETNKADKEFLAAGDNFSNEGDASAKLTKWTKEPTVTDLKRDLEDAKVDTDAHISVVDDYIHSMNMTGKSSPPNVKNRSKIAPKVIRKNAEWRYASLSEPFLATDDIFNVEPETHLDKEAAIQNSLLLNHQFNTKIRKVDFIDEFVRTVVDEGTVVVRVGWKFKEELQDVQIPNFRYEPSDTDEAAAMQAQLHQLMTEEPETYENLPQQLTRSHSLTMDRGYNVMPIQDGTRTVKQMVTVDNHPTAEVCDYQHLTIDPLAKGILANAGFIIYSWETSIAELKADGKYSNLDKVVINDDSPNTDPEHTDEDDTTFQYSDRARKKLIIHEYWGFRDVEGDDELTPIVGAWVGNVMVRLGENPYPDKKLPFAMAKMLPVRRSNYGQPDGFLLEDNQKVIGAVTRGMVDIMARSANGQQGTSKEALDVTNKRKFDNGLDYEFNPNISPDKAFYMHKFPEIPQSASVMLSIQQSEAESLTGVKAFNNGITGKALGESVGLGRSAMDAASKRELGILRRLSMCITDIGRKIISMNAVFLDEEEVIRVTDEEFVPVKRDDLAGNFDLKLTISTPEADAEKAEELAFMLQTTGNNMDPGLTKMILTDIARLRKMPALAKRIESFEPQPDPIAQEKAMLELELLKAQIAKEKSLTVENMSDANLNDAKTVTEGVKAGNVQSDTDQKNLNYVEQELGVTQERDLQKSTEQARGNMALEILKARLNPPKPASTTK